jgi:hypothetical protein
MKFSKKIILANVFLGLGMPHSREGLFPRKEGRIQALAGLAPSCQTVGSLCRTPWPDSLTRKNCQKVCSLNALQWKNALNYF